MTKSAYRISLRQMFLLLACFSVALAVNIPTGGQSGRGNWLGTVSDVFWLLGDVLLATGAAAMVVGLFQQAYRLRASDHLENVPDTAISFTLAFAIGWRISLAIVLVVCLLVELLLAQSIIEIAPIDNPYFPTGYWSGPAFIRYACMFLILASSVMRFTDNTKIDTARPWKNFAFWSVALTISAFVLPSVLFVHSLVYDSLKHVEFSHHPNYRRFGAYVDQELEGYWMLSLSCAALVVLLLVMVIWTHQYKRQVKRSSAGIAAHLLCLALLSLLAYFALWFFTVGYPTIAPEFAVAGLQGNWDHWTVAGLLLLVLLPAAAYRMAVDPVRAVEFSPVSKLNQPAFYETLPLLVCYAIGAFFQLLSTLFLCFSFAWPPWNMSVGFLTWSIATDTYLYLPVAVCWIGLKLVCHNFRNGTAEPRLFLPLLDSRKYVWSCLSLAILIPVGIPVITIYCFCYWL